RLLDVYTDESCVFLCFFFQAEDGIRDFHVTGVQTCALPIYPLSLHELGASVSQFFQIHPENPQARLIKQAVEIIRGGGVVVYPRSVERRVGKEWRSRWGRDQ